MKTTVIHHSNDYDGIFCREIARKFLPDAELIGWHFTDKPLPIPEGQIYVLDLPVDRVFGFDYSVMSARENSPTMKLLDAHERIIWIDHHKSSIESHPKDIPGYRIDGVAACRLAWQWFSMSLSELLNSRNGKFPEKQDFIDRKVSEPMAVRLAGEYDVWDHRGDGDLEFQFGLDLFNEELEWDRLFTSAEYATDVCIVGEAALRCYAKRDADNMRERSFKLQWEGLTFLALNTPRCNSNTFAALDKPETGHDALMAFFYNGSKWSVSLYHAAHRKDIDLSEIAKRMGGGGHRGACGFTANWLPFLLKD